MNSQQVEIYKNFIIEKYTYVSITRGDGTPFQDSCDRQQTHENHYTQYRIRKSFKEKTFTFKSLEEMKKRYESIEREDTVASRLNSVAEAERYIDTHLTDDALKAKAVRKLESLDAHISSHEEEIKKLKEEKEKCLILLQGENHG